MKKLLLASVFLASLPMAANASVVFFGQEDVSAEGFGDAHRLLTMQEPTGQSGTPGNETGFATPVNQANGAAISGADKTTTPSLSALGWTSGASVLMAFDISQVGHTGMTLNTMGFNLFDASNNIVGTFQLASPFQITPAMADEDQGNGKGAILFNLDLAQQSLLNSIITADGTGLLVGAFGNWGCTGTQSATCMAANDGPDSLLGGAFPVATPLPATVWLFGGALAMFGAFKRWTMRKKHGPVSLLGATA